MRNRKWTQEELDILSRMYPDHYAREIAEILGRGLSSIYCQASIMGLKANPEKIRQCGYKTCSHPNSIAAQFKPGHPPHNKGRKMSPEVYARCAPTMFKKGQPSNNIRPVGSERVNVDGYIEIKTANPNTWRLKHRVIWEEAHGPIPQGHNIQFRNHNPLDCSLDNLYMISREEQLATQNSYMAKYPKELQDVIRLKGVINRMIHKQQRNGK